MRTCARSSRCIRSPATVVARADSDINEFDDLLGNRVNIGNPGSGQRALMEVVMEHKGWSTGRFRAGI